MTLPQWLAYLESLHPEEIELGLERIRQVAQRLPLDFSAQKIVCVGGTNGKGSTVSLLSGILQAAGHKVGAYTSPHLLYYNERVCINSQPVSDEALCLAFAQVEEAREDIQLTYFEFGTLAALVVFTQQNLDYILLEVGLGGRLDAVNILDTDLSILTNVAIDHTDWLGDTREAIGHEKSGIYRANKPALYGEHDMPESVLNTVKTLGSNLYRRDEHYSWGYELNKTTWFYKGLDSHGKSQLFNGLPAQGFPLNYSLDNVATVIQAVALLDGSITEKEIISGIQQASLPGRFQKLARAKHTLVLDVAHNPHAAKNLLTNLQSTFPKSKVHLVIAMLQDKDIAKVLEILRPAISTWYLAEIQEDRGAPVKILYNHLQEAGESKLTCFDSIKEAFAAAENAVDSDDIVLVTGSFYTVATVLELV